MGGTPSLGRPRERRPLFGGVYVLVPIWLGAPRPAWRPDPLLSMGPAGFLGRYLVTVGKVLGQKQMGAPSDPPLNRRTGVGRVDPRPGDYADAFTKGNIAHLLASETTGALTPEVIRLLHALDKSTKDAQGHDSTQYGLGRASPQSFFSHHLAAVSCAIVRADALTIRNHAASLAVALAHGFAA